MINSLKFQELSVNEQYFNLAHGYLEGSKSLCNAIIKGDYMPEHSHACVILHLCRQAIELFLKGALHGKLDNKKKLGHQLDVIFSEYKRVHAESQFHFEIPFRFENFEPSDGSKNTDIQECITESINYFNTTLDQRYRYPDDRKGNLLPTLAGFNPTMYMYELEKLSNAFVRLELELKKK